MTKQTLQTVFSLQTVVTSQMGTINNLIHVKKSDFEVFDALQVDSLECSDTSGEIHLSELHIQTLWNHVIVMNTKNVQLWMCVLSCESV